MANPRPPSFEDLEPEGESIQQPKKPADGHEFEHDELDGFVMGSLGDYQFEADEDASYEASSYEASSNEASSNEASYYDEASLELADFETLLADEFLDEDEVDEFFEEERRARPPANLALQAARTALTWGVRANSASLLGANGRRSGSPLAGSQAEACSAGMREARELMHALASAAAAADTQTAASGLVAAMVPVALGLEPKAYRALWPAIPALVHGSMGLTRLLHTHPATRSRIKVMPDILRETMTQLARHALRGQSVPRRAAARVLASVTHAALSHRNDRAGRLRRPKGYRSRPYDFY